MNILLIIFLLFLLIIILILILNSIDNFDNFESTYNFNPFSYGNLNNSSDYIDISQYYNYPTYFKLGEIYVDEGPKKRYDKYLNALHNSRMKNTRFIENIYNTENINNTENIYTY